MMGDGQVHCFGVLTFQGGSCTSGEWSIPFRFYPTSLPRRFMEIRNRLNIHLRDPFWYDVPDDSCSVKKGACFKLRSYPARNTVSMELIRFQPIKIRHGTVVVR
jgi:hypothetical protein